MLKTIASNTLAQLVAKFFGAGLTLLTTYLTIHLAGLTLYGDFTKIIVLVAMGFSAIDFGLNADAIRHAKSESDMRRLTQIVLYVRFILSLLVVLVLNFLVYFLPGSYGGEVKSLFWLGSLSILFQGIYTSGNAYFQYTFGYWRATLAVVVGSLFSTCLTLYFLIFSPSLSGLVLATTLGYFCMATITLIMLPHFPKFLVSSTLLFSTLRRSALLGAILIASILSSKLDTILLGIYRSSNEVGQYGFAYRIFDVILVLPVFVMNSLYPLMVQKKQNFLKTTLLSLGILGILAGLLSYSFAPYLIYIKPEINLSVATLRILSLALPLFYLTAPLMWYLITQKKDLFVLRIYLSAAILNFVGNLWSIPLFGVFAAATITGITELFIFLSLLYHSLSLNRLKFKVISNL